MNKLKKALSDLASRLQFQKNDNKNFLLKGKLFSDSEFSGKRLLCAITFDSKLGKEKQCFNISFKSFNEKQKIKKLKDKLI